MIRIQALLIVHVAAVIFWIGGVSFVTTIVLPTVRTIEDPLAQIKTFLGIEKRFAFLAKIYLSIVGVTGVLLFSSLGGFALFAGQSLYMVAFKTAVLLGYMIMLFGAEKHLMGMLINNQDSPDLAFRKMIAMHWVILILSLLAAAFGVSLVV